MEKEELLDIANEAMEIRANADWSILENAFGEYISTQNESKMLQMIAACLNLNTGKSFVCSVVNKGFKEDFFGCRVFPDPKYLEKVAQEVVSTDTKTKAKFSYIYNTWLTIPEWILEIDASLFNRHEIALNPSEMTALILHEIGHVCYYDSAVERFYRAYEECKVQYKLSDKASFKALYILYMMPLSISCIQKSWISRNNGMRLEIDADMLVANQGYGDYLLSALDKILHAYGTGILKNYSEDTSEKTVREYVSWASLNATDIVHRREHLKDELYTRAHRFSSNYLTILTKNIMKQMGTKMKERYTGLVVEANLSLLSMEKEDFVKAYEMVQDMDAFFKINERIRVSNSCYTSAMEGLFGFKKEPPSRYEIDCIMVEVDKMNDQRDRIFILDLIYDKLNEIEEYEHYMERNKDAKLKYGTEVQNMKEELHRLRQTVLEKKTFERRQYKVFVNYPTGYEG